MFNKGINKILAAEPGIVTAIVGGPGTGKTTVSLIIAKGAERPYLIDTEGLSLERVKQVGATHIKIARVRDFENQHKLIHGFDFDTDLLIIDSLVMLYRLEVSQEYERANKMLAQEIAKLHGIAEEMNIPVVITGHTYTKEGKRKIVGGDIIQYWAKALVLIQKTGIGKRKATLVKHRSLPEGKSCKFRLCNGGIE